MNRSLATLIEPWLREDVGHGDVTTRACVPADRQASGRLVAKAAGVVAGLEAVATVWELADPSLTWESGRGDGDSVAPGDLIGTVSGSAAAVLTAERLALNLLQRLSGVASLTRQFVTAVEGTGVAILDTRKTTPGLRLLEKQAVVAGGGRNHRFGLSDGILIKDNHIIAAGGIAAAVAAARATASHGLKIEVEVETLVQVEEALAAGAEALLLDNMPLELLHEAAALARGRAWTEASGGVTLGTVRAIAESGVDAISVGALTHSATALDISLDLHLER
ncbi:MAG: carboxylating nicotinate-nucleotide diphosphorylase [Armatimonadetes bacterium]|nr:carboxylating nicotinate-nucleotide diphosphorylase [Armatimonadota bacterium]